MRVYVKENVVYRGNGNWVPDGTFYAISSATMAYLTSGMSHAQITEWCDKHDVAIIDYHPSLVRM